MGIVPPNPPAPGNDDRALADWVRTVLGARATLRALPGDASFRKYFRADTGRGTFLALDAPPAREPLGPWLRSGDHLAAAGVHVPAVHAFDLDAGFALVEDLGTELYADALDDGSADRLYADAIAALVAIQGLPRGDLAQYSEDLLRGEMDLFVEWFLGRHLGRHPDGRGRALWEEVTGLLVASAAAQPQVVVHRDYHSRNLVVSDPNPGIIDYQDAVWGPVTYDLASLLCDCYVTWPRPRVLGWIRQWRAVAARSGVAGAGEDESAFLRWFDWMGMQRHLKACGIFARLLHRDGRPGYLDEVPRTLGYVRAVCARYEELSAFGAWLDEVAPMPAAARSAR